MLKWEKQINWLLCKNWGCYQNSLVAQKSKPIDQFRYIKIQPKTIDLSKRLWGITTEFVGFIPWSLELRSIVFGWILIYRNWSILLSSHPATPPGGSLRAGHLNWTELNFNDNNIYTSLQNCLPPLLIKWLIEAGARVTHLLQERNKIPLLTN